MTCIAFNVYIISSCIPCPQDAKMDHGLSIHILNPQPCHC